MHKFKKPFIICHREGEGKGRCRRILKGAEMVFRGDQVVFRGIKWFPGGDEMVFRGDQVAFRGNRGISHR